MTPKDPPISYKPIKLSRKDRIYCIDGQFIFVVHDYYNFYYSNILDNIIVKDDFERIQKFMKTVPIEKFDNYQDLLITVGKFQEMDIDYLDRILQILGIQRWFHQ